MAALDAFLEMHPDLLAAGLVLGVGEPLGDRVSPVEELRKMREEHPSKMWIRRMSVPRGHSCSICRRDTRAMVIVTIGTEQIWWGACLRCVAEMGDAAEQ